MGKSERRQAAEAMKRQRAAEARRKKIVFGTAIGAAVVLIGGLIAVGIWTNRDTAYEVNDPQQASADYAVELGSGPVDVDLYIDYMCPACNQFESEYADEIQAWLDDGSVTVRYHPIAILDRLSQGTEYSSRAGAAAVCASDAGEQEFLDYTLALYENQPAENTRGLNDVELKRIGTEEVGLDSDWEQCVDEETYRGWVTTATEEATGAQGVRGTPTAKVDGTVVESAEFAQEVEAAVAAS